ncbi:MAG: DUF3010 family protein [Lentisphaeraceae bacterium]|nr:DUF3010 family protein [Lentisphaeraceae bacterium]
MKSLGIELKGSTCIGVLADSNLNNLASLKLEIADSYNNEDIQNFTNEFQTFIQKHQPDHVLIKKRQEKGKFAGGAVSFKMEGLIQIATNSNTAFVSGTQLNAFIKKAPANLPEVKKYQSQALFCALYALDI